MAFRSNEPKRIDRKDESLTEEAVLKVRRVSTKRSGGSSFHFSVLSAVGNKAGKIGVALEKSKDASSAVRKSLAKAKKLMVNIELTKDGSIPHEMMVKSGATQIYLKPAPLGAGIIAGGAIRQILDLAGVKNISAKILGSNNQINNAYAIMDALTSLKQRVPADQKKK